MPEAAKFQKRQRSWKHRASATSPPTLDSLSSRHPLPPTLPGWKDWLTSCGDHASSAWPGADPSVSTPQTLPSVTDTHLHSPTSSSPVDNDHWLLAQTVCSLQYLMCLVTWTERFLFWLKLDLVASIMCNWESNLSGVPWPWTVPTAPVFTCRPSIFWPALSGVTFQVSKPTTVVPTWTGLYPLTVWTFCLTILPPLDFSPISGCFSCTVSLPLPPLSPRVPDPELTLAQGLPSVVSAHLCSLAA